MSSQPAAISAQQAGFPLRRLRWPRSKARARRAELVRRVGVLAASGLPLPRILNSILAEMAREGLRGGSVALHRRDFIHFFSDADLLAGELRNGRLVEASTILELWLRPERLIGEIAAFLDECWAPRAAASRRTRRRAAG